MQLDVTLFLKNNDHIYIMECSSNTIACHPYNYNITKTLPLNEETHKLFLKVTLIRYE